MPPRYRRPVPVVDGVERLIVVLLFVVSVVGIYVLTGSFPTAFGVGVLVGAVSVGVVAML